MIIKGLFRRYERWNPVHPTAGAFWGMGIGLGCGVGWGPGFGPEVIGYVGAGCGVGFSVGFTFGGFGIGLPSNWLYRVPYNAAVAARGGAFELGRSSGIFAANNTGKHEWDSVSPHIFELQREASRRLSSLQMYLKEKMNLLEKRMILPPSPQSIWEGLERADNRFRRSDKGSQD